jgi:hypothetical protein
MLKFEARRLITTALCWVITQQVVEFLTNVSGQPIGPVFKVQELLKPEERSSQLLRGGSLKSRM